MEVIAPACHQKKIPPSGNTNRAGNRILSDTRNTALDEKKKNAEMGKKRCEHGREPSRCKDCSGGGPVIFLEATEVEEFDGEEDPDEWVPTVPARVVGGPRGGKRKRKR